MENPYAPPPRDAEDRPSGDGRPGGELSTNGPTGDQGSGAPPSEGRRRPMRSPRAPRPPRTPLPAPDPEALQVVQRRMGTFLLLVLASLLTSRLRLPWQLGGLAFALVALGTGVWALVAARRPGLREQVAPMLVVGLVFTVMLTLTMSSSLLLWSEQMTHQECLDNAVTLSARDACNTAYEDAVQRRLRLVDPRGE